MIRSAEPLHDRAGVDIDAMPAGDERVLGMAPLDVIGVPAWDAVLIPANAAGWFEEVARGAM